MVLAVAVAFTAVLSWFAIARGDHVVDVITRPTFPVLLGGLAWSLATGAGGADVPIAGDPVAVLQPVLVALALQLVVDALLLTATERRYLLALCVSVLAHVAWGWALVSAPGSAGFRWWVPLAVLGLALLHGRWGRDVVRFSGRQRGAVLLQLLSLAVLVVVAAWQQDREVLGGSALLLASYLLLGHDRFVRERRWAPVLVLVLYHSALALLVVGLLGVTASG